MSNRISIHNIALPADIKLVNRRRIFNHFMSGDQYTAMDIHQATGISKPTIMRAIQYFCEQGLIESAGLGEASKVGGQKPEYFVFADKRAVLCIALWPNSITLALSRLVGEVYNLKEYPHPLEGKIEDVFQTVGELSRQYLEKHRLTLDDLYGVEVSTAGTVNYDANVLRYNSQAPGWGRNIPMEDCLKSIFGDVPFYFLENAGKACGRSVLLDYPQLAAQRVLSIFSTWGISACLIENGHVLSGKDSLIGEIGHMTIDSGDQTVCGCGKRGCLETAVKLNRVAERFYQGEDGPPPEGYDALFQASAKGDDRARQAVRYLAHCFAVALHNLSLVYNPDVVVFQGDFALADPLFDECLKSELAEFRYFHGDGAFETYYDARSLSLLAARGGADIARQHFSSSLRFD